MSKKPLPPVLQALVWIGFWACSALTLFLLFWSFTSISILAIAVLPGQPGFAPLSIGCLIMGLFYTANVAARRRQKPRYHILEAAVAKRSPWDLSAKATLGVLLLLFLQLAIAGKPVHISLPTLLFSLLALFVSFSALFALHRLLPELSMKGADSLGSVEPAIDSGEAQWPDPPIRPVEFFLENSQALQKNRMMTQPDPRTVVFCPPVTERIVTRLFVLVWFGGVGWFFWSVATGHTAIPNAASLLETSIVALFAAFSGFFLLGSVGPRRLAIDTVERTYRYTDFKRLSVGRIGKTALRVPFVVEHEGGKLDDDARGIALEESGSQSQELYWMRLIWNDERHPPVSMSAPLRKLEDARELMAATAALLSLPALGQLDL